MHGSLPSDKHSLVDLLHHTKADAKGSWNNPYIRHSHQHWQIKQGLFCGISVNVTAGEFSSL